MVKKNLSALDTPPIPSSCANWDTASEAALIDFLLKNKAEAGDGTNFKTPTFKKAAVHLIPFTQKGGAKSALSCKNKWFRVCMFYHTIENIC